MNYEEKIGTINRGKHAEIAVGWLAPVLERQRETILNKLKMLHRTGEATESNLLAAASSLCTLDDIESDLKSMIRKGNKAREEIENG